LVVAEVPEGIMSGTTLAPFVVVFIDGKSYHITLDSGPFTPSSMKNVTQAYFSGKDTADIKKGLNGLANNSISSLAMSNQMISKNH
jgi:hypothetical protein